MAERGGSQARFGARAQVCVKKPLLSPVPRPLAPGLASWQSLSACLAGVVRLCAWSQGRPSTAGRSRAVRLGPDPVPCLLSCIGLPVCVSLLCLPVSVPALSCVLSVCLCLGERAQPRSALQRLPAQPRSRRHLGGAAAARLVRALGPRDAGRSCCFCCCSCCC